MKYLIQPYKTIEPKQDGCLVDVDCPEEEAEGWRLYEIINGIPFDTGESYSTKKKAMARMKKLTKDGR